MQLLGTGKHRPLFGKQLCDALKISADGVVSIVLSTRVGEQVTAFVEKRVDRTELDDLITLVEDCSVHILERKFCMNEKHVRAFPLEPIRVESGAIQFGDDWPGLFLRGDDAFCVAVAIDSVLDKIKGNTLAHAQLKGLSDMIREQVVKK